MKKAGEISLLIFLIILLIAINYDFLDGKLEGFLIGNDIEYAKVTRIIDGDTIETDDNETVRLLGINTPEKGELYYKEAKDFLEIIILNKTIKIERGKEDRDQYGRLLRYVFLNDKNVNKELVDEGYANFYFPSGKDRYYLSFSKAWEHCIMNNKFLCEKSKDECADCIELTELDVENQDVIFYNKCGFDCSLKDWIIKDEGRKKFVFGNFILKAKKEVEIKVGEGKNNKNILFWRRKDYVWTSGGDTLFLRDNKGKLVVWKNY